MTTRIAKVGKEGFFSEAVRRAIDTLQGGGVVIFPTETVYGVGVRGDLADSVARLRRIKARSTNQAFTAHIPNKEQLDYYVPRAGRLAKRLTKKGWPGPLTLLLPVSQPAQAPVMSGRDGSLAEALYYKGTIGMRCPDDPIAEAILSAVDGPVIAASANRAGEAPPCTAGEAYDQIGSEVDFVLDSGPTRYSKPSTIVRVVDNEYQIVREGVLDARLIAEMTVMRILFICTGNTCRSPMAETLAERMIAEKLGCTIDELVNHGVIVESAGTGGGGGEVSPHSVTVMARKGIDLSEHQSAPMLPEVVHRADVIFAMTRAHREAILAMDSSVEDRVQLLLGDKDLVDPFGGDEEDYERCAKTIEQALSKRIEELSI